MSKKINFEAQNVILRKEIERLKSNKLKIKVKSVLMKALDDLEKEAISENVQRVEVLTTLLDIVLYV